MQVVIDIPKQDYIYIAKKHCLPSCDDRTLRKYIYEMITNGTPLPKGHGDLIDRKSISCENTCVIWNAEQGDIIECNAPTVIEADKAERCGIQQVS